MPQEQRDGRLEDVEELLLYLRRIGRTPQEQLRWALASVERPGGWKGLTRGDRENLRLELAAFAGLSTGLPHNPSHWGPPGSADEIVINPRRLDPKTLKEFSLALSLLAVPNDKQAREILEAFDEMFWAAIRREPITFDAVTVERKLLWHEEVGRYSSSEATRKSTNWSLRAQLALGRAIANSGHLLKLCPAPASRGGEGATCDTRFVAGRPNQAYCSARCQTRAATRAYRSGDSTPVAKLLAAKDRAGRKAGRGA
jgi:hypothetical protein